MVHKGSKTIETERLILRKFKTDDYQAMFSNWASDAKVTKFLSWPTHVNTDISKKVVTEWVAESENDNCYQWAIVLRSINEPIGTIAVVEQNEDLEKFEVGYCIGSKWWHQGIVSEAYSAVIPYLFEDVGVNRIESQHDPNNPNSGKVMEKCGLKYEGTLRQAYRNNQGIVDTSIYSILKDEWIKTR